MQHELIVVSGPGAGSRYTISPDEALVVGRGQASNTQINDPCMSRVHCRLTLRDGAVIAIDQGSSTGTVVGGKKIVEQQLKPGDTVKMGDTTFCYRVDGGSDDDTMVGGIGKPHISIPTSNATPLSDLVGTSFSHYRLDSIISKGHSGMVFKATDAEKNRGVAVKVMAPEYTETDEQKQRFVRAMKTMLPMRHENIVTLYAAGKQGKHCWAAMEYVDGDSLDNVIEEIGTCGMMDWRDTFRVAVHISRALIHAAEHKIIHRNMTPRNLLRRSADKVTKLGDLMLAKALEGGLAKQVTSPGQLVGDVPYMSPERTRQDVTVDGRSDIYELGSTLYALLTGRAPFESNSLPELVRQVREEIPELPKKFHLAVPEQFQDIVMTMLEKRPDNRHATPEKLLEDLTRVGKFQGVNASQL